MQYVADGGESATRFIIMIIIVLSFCRFIVLSFYRFIVLNEPMTGAGLSSFRYRGAAAKLRPLQRVAFNGRVSKKKFAGIKEEDGLLRSGVTGVFTIFRVGEMTLTPTENLFFLEKIKLCNSSTKPLKIYRLRLMRPTLHRLTD